MIPMRLGHSVLLCILKLIYLDDLKYLTMLFSRLYNKDAIIEYLLDKSAERPNAEAVTHVRGIKVYLL